MQIAPEIIFHDVDRSQWVEEYITQRVQRLERYADRITKCHVTLAQEQASHHKGNSYSVMVEVRMPPNHDLAAKKEMVIHDMQAELPGLVNLAFGAVEKQLKKAKGAKS
jgi:ribosomal subunit interface protein